MSPGFSKVATFLCAALSTASLILRAGAGHCADSGRAPNIVLILADDLGYGDLSCYGAQDLQTPNIDALAASGMRFTRFYANSCVCSPTRAALLTGRFPERVGVPGVIRTHPDNSWGSLARDAVLLPAVLRKAGYHTALVGKWHLGLASPNTPNERGFDYFHGFLGDMMDDYWTHRRHGINYLRLNDQTIDPAGHATDLFTQWAVDYLRQRAGNPQPFFLYLAYNAPHNPIQPPEQWLQRVKARCPDVTAQRAALVALVEHMDHGVGQVMAALRQTGAAENTLVIFTSDNGGALPFAANNGPLRDGKGSMYEGGLRVPMCAVWPGRIPKGTTCDRVALSMDLFATCCEAAQATAPAGIEARSLLPTLLGQAQPVEDRDVFFIRREGGVYRGQAIHAVRRGPWKLVQNTPQGPKELFNLDADPREQRDLSRSHPRIFEELGRALDEHRRFGDELR